VSEESAGSQRRYKPDSKRCLGEVMSYCHPESSSSIAAILATQNMMKFCCSRMPDEPWTDSEVHTHTHTRRPTHDSPEGDNNQKHNDYHHSEEILKMSQSATSQPS